MEFLCQLMSHDFMIIMQHCGRTIQSEYSHFLSLPFKRRNLWRVWDEQWLQVCSSGRNCRWFALQSSYCHMEFDHKMEHADTAPQTVCIHLVKSPPPHYFISSSDSHRGGVDKCTYKYLVCPKFQSNCCHIQQAKNIPELEAFLLQ
jgi:hypothetical protein